MAKIDLDAMSIEEVADLRDIATDKTGGEGRGTARRTRSRTGKARAIRQAGAKVAGRSSRGQAQEEPGEWRDR